MGSASKGILGGILGGIWLSSLWISPAPSGGLAHGSSGGEKIDPKSLVQVKVSPSVKAAAPGQALHLLVDFKIAKTWHIYWENPGDSGMATRVNLAENPQVNGGDLIYPGPDLFVLPGDIYNYGYADAVQLALPLTVSKTAAITDAITLKGEVRYLACHEACIPLSHDFEVKLPLQDVPVADPHQPEIIGPLKGAKLIPPGKKGDGVWRVKGLKISDHKGIYFFPKESMGFAYRGQTWNTEKGILHIEVEAGAALDGILKVGDAYYRLEGRQD